MRGNMTGAQTNLENQEIVFWEAQFKMGPDGWVQISLVKRRQESKQTKQDVRNA